MKKYLLISLLTTLMMSYSQAQMPETTPLEDGDVEKFISTFKPLTADLEDLGEQFTNVEDYKAIQAFAANAKVKAVYEKHGWDESWTGKWVTISMAYTILKLEVEMAKLPADQRAQMEQYMSASNSQLKEMVTEGDIEKVKAKMNDLNTLFDN